LDEFENGKNAIEFSKDYWKSKGGVNYRLFLMLRLFHLESTALLRRHALNPKELK
jgi:hypothetical protein